MAMLSHRLRRALLTATSCINRSISPASVAPPSDSRSVSTLLQRSVLCRFTESTLSPVRVRLFSTREYKLYKEGDEITPETVLFEGCDYNHWLITIDFPKDHSLSPEEMVSTYEQTCATGLGISLEDAKKKIYACSTTTYQGFQAIMTEQESEKFKDLPGVVFILPDSYIDPQNKEYGGDKYENGVITHRPPPFQPNRKTRDRFSQRSDRQGGGGNFQRNTPYGQQPPMQGGGGGYGGPQQSYGAPGQGTQAPPPPSQGGYSQGPAKSPPPPYQGGYNQGQGSLVPPPTQAPPPFQGGYNQGPARSPPPPYQAAYNHGQGSPVPPYQGTPGGYSQGGPGNYGQGIQGGYNQGGPRDYSPQGNGNYDPAPGAGYGQVYSGAGQEQSQTFPQADQRNAAGDWNNNNPAGQPGSDQFPQGRRY